MKKDINNLPNDHSAKLQWLREQAEFIRIEFLNGKIDEATMKSRINNLLKNPKSCWEQLIEKMYCSAVIKKQRTRI